VPSGLTDDVVAADCVAGVERAIDVVVDGADGLVSEGVDEVVVDFSASDSTLLVGGGGVPDASRG